MNNNPLFNSVLEDPVNTGVNTGSFITAREALSISKQSLEISKKSLKIWEDNILNDQLRHRAEFNLLTEILAELKNIGEKL